MGLVISKPHTAEYGETASLLLQMADEMGFSPRVVKTVPGGFEVPDEISSVLMPAPVTADPPAWWSTPQPEIDIETAPDGRVMLTEAARARLVDEIANPVAGTPVAAGREEIRAWALAGGFEPAPVGKLKQSVIAAFRAANPDRATSE